MQSRILICFDLNKNDKKQKLEYLQYHFSTLILLPFPYLLNLIFDYNLIIENIDPDSILVTGNSVIDALLIGIKKIKNTKSKTVKELEEKIFERNPDTGVIRWRYVDESPDKFGWPNYGRILKEKKNDKRSTNKKTRR